MTNNKTSKKRMSNGMKRAMKRPWRITYRNRHGNRTQRILKNGDEKDNLLKKLDKHGLRTYGINNLTDGQIQYYERVGLLPASLAHLERI
jgi:hypothetical protein